ncbi:hypothetical protein BIV57_03300 [Mangrovactinospora gilvigrisea]|uniref:Uncharacterized protein n=1 Tax=Mangrovactinospora gilvigrisea TaxID=1428644 RepID=A0A1J7CGZ0_9ACTN|nr:hypothetical protein [Mangrovactinospora gilvigrisea]OIV38906.1 hypothetical protein BIV57_03300 [Mangrovactinospora gilvigrisea]
MLDETRAGRLTAWGNAALAGSAAPDDVVHEVARGELHRVVGLPGAGSDPAGVEQVTLAIALGRLRNLGVRSLRLALPVPGHPLGLCGPPEFNALALEAGEAVVAGGADPGTGAGPAFGLVPEVTEPAPHPEVAEDDEAAAQATVVLWRCVAARDGFPADVPSLSEAERELSEAMREATAALAGLDLAGAGPDTLAALEEFRRRSGRHRVLLAPGYPPRAVRVLESAQRVAALVGLASAEGEGGAAVTAAELSARESVLRPLERVARRAQVAAYNAYGY